MKKQRLIIATLLLVSLLFSVQISLATEYYYYDLGAGAGSTARDINDYGQVVGGYSSGGTNTAFLWTPSSGIKELGIGYSTAYGINNSGQIVGNYTTSSGYSHAFLWTNTGGLKDLGTKVGWNASVAYDINNSGQVVGSTSNSSGSRSDAAYWSSSGSLTDLGTLGGATGSAYSINNSGVVVGGAGYTGGVGQAFSWTEQDGMKNLGSLLGSYSGVARAINYSGQIVGTAGFSSYSRPFLLNPQGPVQLLWGNNGSAYGINDQGQVVGFAGIGPSGQSRAFIWTPNDGMKDLNSLTVNLPTGVTLVNVSSINNKGQIVGSAGNGAFSLSPNALSLDLPKPTATPDASAFLTPSNLFPGAVSFIKNNASSFSEPSQQFLNDNLNSVERFMVKHTSGPGWKFAFSFGEEFSKNLGFVMSVNSVCAAFAVNPLAGTFALGEFAGKDLLYKAAGINNDYQARLFIDSSILAAKSSGIVTPISFLSSLNKIIWGDILAGQFAQLANDPPDLNFKEIFQSRLAYNAPFNFAGVTSGLNRLLGLEFGSVYETYYLMEGMTTSINRYSSALSAGDTASAGLQFEAFIKYLTLYDSSAIQTADYMKQLRQALIDQGMTDFYYDKQALLDLQNQIRLNGLPQDLIDYYKSLGLTDSDIAAMKQAMLDFIPPDSLSGTLYSNLSDGANLFLYESSSPVPLPSSIYLFLPGFIGILVFRRKIRKG